MPATATNPAATRPRVRWRAFASNGGLAALFTLFVVSNGAAFLDKPRLSILLLVVFQATVVALSVVRHEASTFDQSLAAFLAGWAGTVLPLLLRPTAAGGDLPPPLPNNRRTRSTPTHYTLAFSPYGRFPPSRNLLSGRRPGQGQSTSSSISWSTSADVRSAYRLSKAHSKVRCSQRVAGSPG